jgi:hypothetical protein
MPVTIVRTNMQDDDGTGTTGTVINNAWKTEFYNQIDQALAKVPMLTGNNALTGNLSVSGVLTVNGLGQHGFVGTGVGGNVLQLRNTSPGAGNYMSFWEGNDVGPSQFVIATFASNYAVAGMQVADGSMIAQSGAGGLSIAATGTGGNANIRFYTGTTANLRWTMDLNGLFYTGQGVAGQVYTTLLGGQVQFGTAGTGAINVAIFVNANGTVGAIQTSGAGTSYLQTSDARLKTDRGLAHDTTVLERTEIHEYEWIADGAPARGVFAQDAHTVAPFANTPGTDERDAEGRLVRPWMTDYSKYVPDLIVGWQQHAAALAAIRADLAALKG